MNKSYNELSSSLARIKRNICFMDEEYVFDDKKLKIVISPVIASKLCNLGYKIVKLKKKKNIQADGFQCNVVFLFEATEDFLKDFYELTEKTKEQ